MERDGGEGLGGIEQERPCLRRERDGGEGYEGYGAGETVRVLTSPSSLAAPPPPFCRAFLDPELFMFLALIRRLRRRYGTVSGYLDHLGFTEEYRKRLRRCASVASAASVASGKASVE